MIRYKFVNENRIIPIDYTLELSFIKNQYETIILNKKVTDEVIISIKAKKKKTKEDLKKIKLRLAIEDEFSKKIDSLNEYKVLSQTDEDKPLKENLSKYEISLPYYVQQDDKIIRKWKTEKNNSMLIRNRINELKALLIKSDIKINKCFEAQFMGNEMPVNLKDLISERQAQRDEINELEILL